MSIGADMMLFFPLLHEFLFLPQIDASAKSSVGAVSRTFARARADRRCFSWLIVSERGLRLYDGLHDPVYVLTLWILLLAVVVEFLLFT